MKNFLLWSLLLLRAPSAMAGLDWDSARHAANRLGFGATPEQIREIQAAGLSAYLDKQLAADPSAKALPDWAPSMDTLDMSIEQLYSRFPKPPKQDKKKGNQSLPEDTRQTLTLRSRRLSNDGGAGPGTENRPDRRGPVEDFQQAKLLRALASPYPLLEVMEDFWFNHFNVDAKKGACRWMLGPYLRDVIRPRALENFPDLLQAVAESPAMLFYLDNWKSSSPAPRNRKPGTRNRKQGAGFPKKGGQRGLNENYGRELLELHTLGVDGGYSQEDVIQTARVLTGWSLSRPNQGEAGFIFRESWHEPGPKRVLGWSSEGGGREEGLSLLRYLALHPVTARRICRKLAQRFLEDDPPAALLDRMTAAYLHGQGGIKPVLRVLILSPEFMDPGRRLAKVRSPFEWLAASLRLLGSRPQPGKAMESLLTQMGQPTFHCEPPTGYPETGAGWVHPGGLLSRWNVAMGLASGRLKGLEDEDLSGLAENPTTFEAGLGLALNPLTRDVIQAESSPRARLALMLGSPEFLRR